MLTIIEDCSPFYIRFVYPDIKKVIALATEWPLPITNKFVHRRLPIETATQILLAMPFFDKLDWKTERVSVFVSPAGYTHFPHKDGQANFSINFGLSILDDKCVTNWYSDADIDNNFTTTNNLPFNRALVPLHEFNKNKQTPIKSMVARQGECVLLNTDIYHDFDNSKSENIRSILTLRIRNPWQYLFFDDVKRILFNK